MNAAKPTLPEKLDELPSRLEYLCSAKLADVPSTICLQKLEVLAECLRGMADEVDRMVSEVADVCIEQREEAEHARDERRPMATLNVRGQRVPLELLRP